MAITESQAQEKIRQICNCSDEELNRMFSKSGFGRWPPEVREAALQRIDRDIEEAMDHIPDIPHSKNLGRDEGGPLPYSARLINDRFNANDGLRIKKVKRGIWFAQNCSKEVFFRSLSTNRWNWTRGEVRKAIEERLDLFIREAIRSFEGEPTYCMLSAERGGPLPCGSSTIQIRLKKNPTLRQECSRKEMEDCTKLKPRLPPKQETPRLKKQDSIPKTPDPRLKKARVG